MNFTPFPNQVQMARLGQEEEPRVIAELRSRIQATAMSSGTREAFLEKLTECAGWLNAGENAEFSKCYDGIREALSNPLLPNLSTREEVERSTQELTQELTRKQNLESTLTWVGLAALVAGIGWFIYKK